MYSEITVEIGTHLKTEKITLNIFAVNVNPGFKYFQVLYWLFYFVSCTCTLLKCFIKTKSSRKRLRKYKIATSGKISPYYLSGLLSSRVLPAPFGNETSLLCEQKKEEKKLRERPDFANYVPFLKGNIEEWTEICTRTAIYLITQWNLLVLVNL